MSATSSTCRWYIPMQAFGLLQCFLLLSLTIIFLQLPEVFFISSGTIFLTYSCILRHRLILASPLSATCRASGCQILGGDLRPLWAVFFCVLTYQCISSCLILQLSIKWLVLDLHCGTQRTVGTCSCSMCLSSCILENLFGVDHLPTLWHHWVTLIQAEDQWVNVSLMPVVQLDVIHAQEIADYYSTNLLWICIKNTYRLVVGKSFTNGK